MKALSLWQPWASLIAHGIKTIETRSWPPPKSLIGQRIAIHAAKRWTRAERDLCLTHEFREVLEPLRSNLGGLVFYENALPLILPRGVVVCTAVLKDSWMVNVHDDHDGARVATSHFEIHAPVRTAPIDQWGDFAPGRWLWFLDDIQTFSEPIAVRGRQGIFDVELHQGQTNHPEDLDRDPE